MSGIRGTKLRKREKLMQKAEYVRVLRKGTRVSSQNFTLAFLKNSRSFARIGHVVAKKVVRTAVSRNRIKRRFREVFRLNKHRFDCNDVVFMAKTDTSGISFSAVSREILGLVSREK